MPSTPKPVLLYDGGCGLCNAVMRFMLRHDRCGVLLFAPLQGTTGQAFLRAHGLNAEDFESLVFVADITKTDTAWFQRTAGVLRAMAELGGGWRRLARMLAVVPAPCGDLIYKTVARMRRRVFGRYRPMPLKNADWAQRMLD